MNNRLNIMGLGALATSALIALDTLGYTMTIANQDNPLLDNAVAAVDDGRGMVALEQSVEKQTVSARPLAEQSARGGDEDPFRQSATWTAAPSLMSERSHEFVHSNKRRPHSSDLRTRTVQRRGHQQSHGAASVERSR